MKNGRQNGYHLTRELPPHNIEAEEALLGSLLIDPDAIVKIIDRQINRDDFHVVRLGWIYEVILDLFRQGKPADLITISDELERRGHLAETGAPAILSQLINLTPSSLHVGYYADIVKRRSIQRQLIRASGDIAKLAHNAGEVEPEQLLQSASNILLEVSTGNQAHEPQAVNHYCQQVLDRIEMIKDHNGGITGLPTGTDLDRILKGLQKGHLILVAGRPGMGKSSLAIQIARCAARQQRARSLIFSLEMPGEELTSRMVSAESGIDSQRLKSGPLADYDYEAIVTASVRIAQLPICIDDRSRTIEEIRAKAIINRSKYGLDLLIVDYIQRVQASGKYHQTRDAEIGAISAALKSLAIDLNIPIMAVASLSRKCEERANKRPILSDLRESGNLEYDADEILFLYRDDIYDPDQPAVAEISIAKHRSGALGVVKTFFQKETTTFMPLTTQTITFEQIGGSNGRI